jgi:hypothetical protein
VIEKAFDGHIGPGAAFEEHLMVERFAGVSVGDIVERKCLGDSGAEVVEQQAADRKSACADG